MLTARVCIHLYRWCFSSSEFIIGICTSVFTFQNTSDLCIYTSGLFILGVYVDIVLGGKSERKINSRGQMSPSKMISSEGLWGELHEMNAK